jgi:hypothetical protein
MLIPSSSIAMSLLGVGEFSYNNDKMFMIIQSLIPTAIATTSVLIYQSKVKPGPKSQQQSQSPSQSPSQFLDYRYLLLQISLLIALILFHNIIFLKATHNTSKEDAHALRPSSSSSSDIGIDIDTDTDIDVILEFSYLSVLLAIFASCIHSSLRSCTNILLQVIFRIFRQNNRRNHKRIHFFISCMTVGLKSIVPASLSFVYTILFLTLNNNNNNNNNNKDHNQSSGKILDNKDKLNKVDMIHDVHDDHVRVLHEQTLLFLFFITWSFLTISTLRSRHALLKRPSRPSSLMNQQHSMIGLPFQFGSSSSSLSSSLSTIPNELEWEQWTTFQLLSWIKGIYYENQSQKKFEFYQHEHVWYTKELSISS